MNFQFLYQNFIDELSSIFVDSAQVDLLLFSLGEKPCVRTRIQYLDQDKIANWCSKFNIHFLIDEELFIYLSLCPNRMHRAYDLDHSLDPHALSLGKILGYPPCCCACAQDYGEDQLDLLENRYREVHFQGEYALINPCFYTEGCALISHLPCRWNCERSLAIGKRVWKSLTANLDIPSFHIFLMRLKKKLALE